MTLGLRTVHSLRSSPSTAEGSREEGAVERGGLCLIIIILSTSCTEGVCVRVQVCVTTCLTRFVSFLPGLLLPW